MRVCLSRSSKVRLWLEAGPCTANDVGSGVFAGHRDSLIVHCRPHLAPYKVPRSIDIVDEHPKTSLSKGGKVDLVARPRRG